MCVTRLFKNWIIVAALLLLPAAPVRIKAEEVYSSESTEQHTVSFKLPLEKGMYVYKDFIRFRFDTPGISMLQWKGTQGAVDYYDETFKENKKVFKDEINFNLELQIDNPSFLPEANLHITYYTTQSQNPHELVVSLASLIPGVVKSDDKTISEVPTDSYSKMVENSLPFVEKQSSQDEETQSWSDALMDLVRLDQPLWLRLLLVFLLGFLLSLTPCMYPMIPITIGILQAQGTKSLTNNFLRSCSYTSGLATTFALFGLLASCLGSLCGSFLSTPWFVLLLVLLLAYFAFSMLGLYDIHIPSFLQPKNSVRGSSLVALYLLGAASGTFASPCVSPGLALLLTIVATLGNKILGFMFLYFFGLGLGVPLLIIGTLSSSTAFLPRAGIWMVEVKRLFGVMMLGACVYYAAYIVPLWLLYWLVAVLLLVLGIFYATIASGIYRSIWASIDTGIAILLIAAACVSAYYGVRETWLKPALHSNAVHHVWYTEYDEAVSTAQQHNKLLFLDFWAPYCPSCVTINKKVLTQDAIEEALDLVAVKLKIDVSQSQAWITKLQKELLVMGVPAFILFNPHTNKVLHRWGAELSTMKPEKFIAELKKGASQKK